MQYVEARGARIPALGMGTWQLKGTACRDAVTAALDLGYRHLDTAQAYENEADVGAALAESGVARDDVFVTTKVWYEQARRDDLLQSVDASLRRLKLDHVDLLLLHWPNADVPLDETMAALNTAVDRGLTRFVGVSNFPSGMLRNALELAPLVEHATLVDDMLTVADAAGAEQLDIYAPSQNVPVAIAFAARHPERVRRMVLIGGFLQGAAIRGVEDKEMSDAFVALVRGGWGPHGAAHMRSLSAFFMPDATEAQIQAFVTMLHGSISPQQAVAHRQAISRLDARAEAPRVTAPTLVIHATGDTVQPFTQGQVLARAIPDAEFLALESANHIPLPQDPAWTRMMDAVDRFLAEG